MIKDVGEFFKERSAWYKTINSVFCPILDEEVVFNSKGFYHLKYKSSGTKRPKKEQMYKIGLLPLVIPVIKKASEVHDYKKINSDSNKTTEIWELRALAGKQDTQVSVVLRRMGDGKIHFFSVWKK